MTCHGGAAVALFEVLMVMRGWGCGVGTVLDHFRGDDGGFGIGWLRRVLVVFMGVEVLEVEVYMSTVGCWYSGRGRCKVRRDHGLEVGGREWGCWIKKGGLLRRWGSKVDCWVIRKCGRRRMRRIIRCFRIMYPFKSSNILVDI